MARETVRAGWVISAEGSHSVLRDALGIPWRTTRFGGTQLVQVDAFAHELPSDGPGEAHLYMTGDGFLGDLPLPDGRRRLFAAVADPDPENRLDPSVEEMEAYVRKLSGAPDIRLESPLHNWRVRLHNSVAAQFRKGRCFLVGDAARTVMPVTAQGMNTGIQDAFNLGWKLAAVIAGAPDQLLDTYNTERLPVAHDLLMRTERSFWGGVGTPPLPRLSPPGSGSSSRPAARGLWTTGAARSASSLRSTRGWRPVTVPRRSRCSGRTGPRPPSTTSCAMEGGCSSPRLSRPVPYPASALRVLPRPPRRWPATTRWPRARRS